VNSHHAHAVLGAGEDHRLKAVARLNQRRHALEDLGVILVEGQVVQMIRGEDDELGEVDGVGALAQHPALGALLSTGGQKARRVLKVLGHFIAAQGLAGVEGPAVAGEDVADLSLGDGHQGHPVHRELKGHPPVRAAAQDLGLKAGLAVQGDEAALNGAGGAPALFEDADAVIGDDRQADEPEEQEPGEQQEPQGWEDEVHETLRHNNLRAPPCRWSMASARRGRGEVEMALLERVAGV